MVEEANTAVGGHRLGPAIIVAIGVAMATLSAVAAARGIGGQPVVWGVLAGVGGGLILVGVIKAWRHRRIEAMTSEGGRRDLLQRQRNRQLTILPALMLMFIAQAIGALEAVANGHARLVHYLQILVPVLYGWVIPAIVMGWDYQSKRHRRYLDDEFTRALRARALFAAFVTLMAGATLALGLGLWRPSYAVVALPLVLAISGAVAGLRFAWLDREAELG